MSKENRTVRKSGKGKPRVGSFFSEQRDALPEVGDGWNQDWRGAVTIVSTARFNTVSTRCQYNTAWAT